MNAYLSAALKRFVRMYVVPSRHNTMWEAWVREETRSEVDLIALVENPNTNFAQRKRAFLTLIAPDVRLLPFYWEYAPERGHYVHLSPPFLRFMKSMGNSSLLQYGASNLARYFAWAKQRSEKYREVCMTYNDLACLLLARFPYANPDNENLADLIEPWHYSALDSREGPYLVMDIVLRGDIHDELKLRVDRNMRTTLALHGEEYFDAIPYSELLVRYATAVKRFIDATHLEPVVMALATKILIKEQLAFLAATNYNKVRCLTEAQSKTLVALELIDNAMARALTLPHTHVPIA